MHELPTINGFSVQWLQHDTCDNLLIPCCNIPCEYDVNTGQFAIRDAVSPLIAPTEWSDIDILKLMTLSVCYPVELITEGEHRVFLRNTEYLTKDIRGKEARHFAMLHLRKHYQHMLSLPDKPTYDEVINYFASKAPLYQTLVSGYDELATALSHSVPLSPCEGSRELEDKHKRLEASIRTGIFLRGIDTN